MIKKLCFLILFIIFGCNEEKQSRERKSIEKLAENIEIEKISNLQQLNKNKNSDNYGNIKQEIRIAKDKLILKNAVADSISALFTLSLLNRILPIWEGTKWSFEGHTSIPQKGEIACGYFVSTTLKDTGLNINRYKLAQQSPINEAKSLAINTQVKEVSSESVSKNIESIRSYLKEGIHFIGFDKSHVGFVWKNNDQLYLIHSNYINSEGVIIEAIENSDVFKSHSKFYIVELSTNMKFLNYWIQEKQIEIYQNEPKTIDS